MASWRKVQRKPPLNPRGFQDDDEDFIASCGSILIPLCPDLEIMPFSAIVRLRCTQRRSKTPFSCESLGVWSWQVFACWMQVFQYFRQFVKVAADAMAQSTLTDDQSQKGNCLLSQSHKQIFIGWQEEGLANSLSLFVTIGYLSLIFEQSFSPHVVVVHLVFDWCRHFLYILNLKHMIDRSSNAQCFVSVIYGYNHGDFLPVQYIQNALRFTQKRFPERRSTFK